MNKAASKCFSHKTNRPGRYHKDFQHFLHTRPVIEQITSPNHCTHKKEASIFRQLEKAVNPPPIQMSHLPWRTTSILTGRQKIWRSKQILDQFAEGFREPQPWNPEPPVHHLPAMTDSASQADVCIVATHQATQTQTEVYGTSQPARKKGEGT